MKQAWEVIAASLIGAMAIVDDVIIVAALALVVVVVVLLRL